MCGDFETIYATAIITIDILASPERWFDNTAETASQPVIPPPYHFAFGAGARMCTAVKFSNRVHFLRIIVSFHLTTGRVMSANTHYTDYKRDPAEANAIPADLKVRVVPRDVETLGIV